MIADPERALALRYAPGDARQALAALWALDEALGAILRAGRDPMVSQLRLTWWHEALCRLDHTPPPPQPLLQAIASDLLSRGPTGASLAAMIDGWEVLLDPDPIDDTVLADYAAARGGQLFTVAGAVIGDGDAPWAVAGQGWALVDLARYCGEADLATNALRLARPLLDEVTRRRWQPASRSIGMLAHLAAIDARVATLPLPMQGSPRRMMRMITHRITGR